MTRTLTVLSLLLLAAPPALAQEVTVAADASAGASADASADAAADASWVKSQGNRAGLEFDINRASQELSFFGVTATTSLTGMMFTGVGQIQLTDKIHLDVELPFAYGSVATSIEGTGPDGIEISEEESESGFALGNPTVGVHYADHISPDLAFFAGGTVSVPTIFDPSDEQSLAVFTNILARAYVDTHRIVPEHLPIRPRGGVELRILPWLLYRGDLTAATFIPLDGGDLEVILEQGNEIEARTGSGFGGGLRLQEALLLTGSGDIIQTAAEPFLSYEPPAPGVFVRAGFLLALDEELGFGLDQGKVSTFRLAVGGKF